MGRYLMDHPSVRIGHISARSAKPVLKTFSFFGVPYHHQVHMYQHGMRVSEAVQRNDTLLNASAYVLEDRAPDDPWDAIKRILKRQSSNYASDLLSVLTSPGLLIKGIGLKILQSPKVPERLKSLVIDTVLMVNPGLAVSEFQSGGLPHKLAGLMIDAIVEQPPRRENRITLSETPDRLGVPRARVSWKIGDQELDSLLTLSRLIADEFPKLGLPAPDMEPWVKSGNMNEAPVIDMGHTCGTTRMSLDPEHGVVDTNCQVHGVGGLFVAGSSVFPTSGHANPTLMSVSVALRLADHLKSLLN